MRPKSNKVKRRNYYIDKKFQTKFVIQYCALIAAGSLMIVVLIYVLAQHSTTVGIANGRVAVHTTAEYLLPLLLQTVFAQLVLVSLGAILMTVMVSHKIVGPLYRLKVMLGKLGEGDICSPMKLRQNDQLQQLATVYNDAVGKLNAKIKAIESASSMGEVKDILKTFKT